jgi:hypothetical protein
MLVTAGATEGTVERWDLDKKSRAASPIQVVRPRPKTWLHGLAMTPDGRHVATANPDGTVSVLRLAERAVSKPASQP